LKNISYPQDLISENWTRQSGRFNLTRKFPLPMDRDPGLGPVPWSTSRFIQNEEVGEGARRSPDSECGRFGSPGPKIFQGNPLMWTIGCASDPYWAVTVTSTWYGVGLPSLMRSIAEGDIIRLNPARVMITATSKIAIFVLLFILNLHVEFLSSPLYTLRTTKRLPLTFGDPPGDGSPPPPSNAFPD